MEKTAIRCERRDGIWFVELNRGVTNPINPTLVRELSGVVRKVREDPDPGVLVMTGSGTRFFSIGFDIPELFPLAEEEFRSFYRSFNRLCLDLFTLPKPTLAAVEGHAIAGGCILALCCDTRFLAAGRKLMGLNEIHLGVPVPWSIDRILHHLVGFRHAREVTDTGAFFPPERLLAMGMVDRVLPADQIVPEAESWAHQAYGWPSAAFARIKANRTDGIRRHILESLEDREEFFIRSWYSDIARSRLQEAMKKFTQPD
jgi:enoyl-CoA hydratase/carnithine racemase